MLEFDAEHRSSTISNLLLRVLHPARDCVHLCVSAALAQHLNASWDYIFRGFSCLVQPEALLKVVLFSKIH